MFLMSKAEVYDMKGDKVHAREVRHSCIEMLKKELASETHPRKRLEIENNLAHFYFLTDNPDEAERLLKKVIADAPDGSTRESAKNLLKRYGKKAP